MKQIFRSFVLALIAALLAATAVFALITNGNFETGDFTGWTKSSFINKEADDPPGVGGSDLSAIVGGPAVAPMSLSDPNTGGKLKYPAVGHYSARVNSELSSSKGGYPRNGNTISQHTPAVSRRMVRALSTSPPPVTRPSSVPAGQKSMAHDPPAASARRRPRL